MVQPSPPVVVQGDIRTPLFNFNPETGEIKFNPTLVILPGVPDDQVKSALQIINKNPEGKRLLAAINYLYEEIDKRGFANGLVFKPPSDSLGKTAFAGKCDGGKEKLTIEIAGTDESEYPVLHETQDPKVAAIHSVSAPFWITLAHELIHLKHYLEQECQYEILISQKGIPYGEQQRKTQEELFFKACSDLSTAIKNIPYSIAINRIRIEDVLLSSDPLVQQLESQQRQQLIESLPELQELRINMTELWPNLEERRTVLGSGSGDDISEASIRHAAGMPPRYIYQNKEINFLENRATIEKALGKGDISFEGPPIEDLRPYYLKPEEGVTTLSELTPFPILIRQGVTQEQIDDRLAAQENPIKKRRTVQMHSKVKEFQKPPLSPLSSASSVITLTEQINNPILLAAIRKDLKAIPEEIRDEVNCIVGKAVGQARATGASPDLSDIQEMITKTAEEIQSKTKIIEKGVDTNPSDMDTPDISI
ncbi:MAG: hypothetical protein ACD_21C00266G0007 [uncultured bacterium]|nr:MAG: hypothetical protein ACD_21C00266G0007 [uncultured bacterium]